jgi:hypothetical protein
MKIIIFTIKVLCILSLYSNDVFSQFTDPTGGDGSMTQVLKTIKEGDHNASPPSIGHQKKKGTPRRLQFRATFYPECWYIEENLPYGGGWNKVGKIAGIYEGWIPDEDWYKLHVGWRMKTIDNDQYLGIALYSHINGEILAHWLDTIPFNSYTGVWIDMYLGRNVLGLVSGDKCIGIRNTLSGEFWDFRTRFRKTFYFGGNSSAPHIMYLLYDNIHYDKRGYQEYFNSRNFMIWNLTRFENGDDFIFYANKLIEGSIRNPGAVTSLPPNFNKQECVIGNGAKITFISGEKILLHPGFKVESGGQFKALISDKKYADSILVHKQIANLPPLDDYLNNADYTDDITLNHESGSIGSGLDKRLDFIIYPNPTSGIFNVEAEGSLSSGYALEVINMMGNTVFSETNVNKTMSQIDISAYPKGIYFVKLSCGEIIHTEKIVYR